MHYTDFRFQGYQTIPDRTRRGINATWDIFKIQDRNKAERTITVLENVNLKRLGTSEPPDTTSHQRT